MRVTVTEDVESFMLEVPGASGSLVRTGPTTSETRIAIDRVDSSTLATLEFGFAVLGEAVAHPDALVVTHMLRVPSPGRWDGVDLRPGLSFVYAPGTEHAAADPAGLRFALAAVPWVEFVSAAGILGVDPERASRRRPIAADGGHRSGSWWCELMADRLHQPTRPEVVDHDAVLESLVQVLGGTEPVHRTRRRRWEDLDLVHESLMFLEAVGGWKVPVLSLCRHVGVSERRLQTAFRNIYEMGPQRFMHQRALQGAQRVLERGDPSEFSVGEVAASHGFGHAGRFARDYAATFGEPPSTTLRRSAPLR